LPGTAEAEVVIDGKSKPMERIPETDFFTFKTAQKALPDYHLRWRPGQGEWRQGEDPYRFGPAIGDLDLHLFAEGKHEHIYRILGAHCCEHEGVSGVRFATWAPNAQRVSVVGDFNQWHGLSHPMRTRGLSGVWELFIPGLDAGETYKLELRDANGKICLKADPYGNSFEMRPATAAIVCPPSEFQWTDQQWLEQRAHWDWQHAPISIYEFHPSSWRRDGEGNFLNFRDMAGQLADYVSQLGFTHVELLPITEHPLDDSWGYQTTGYFAPSQRFGSPDDFRYFVDHLHQRGIGVILDWVPAHFPRDAHALARFDGTALYEHADPRRGEHTDWGTLIFNYGRNEVKNFLLASANYWLEEFHLDGLRVDAVASMLYLDYSRGAGEWEPNEHGGNENLGAVAFLRQLTSTLYGTHPGIQIVAEESTAWPGVTMPADHGGLGFGYKWDMGWMHDSLEYFAHEPVHRSFHQNDLTFRMLYAYDENFILALSHDEVVHGKGSLVNKMPGDEWQQFANLRALYGYQYALPGKKCLFMGGEFGQRSEWSVDHQLEWFVAEHDNHAGLQRWVADLNTLYRRETSLFVEDYDAAGFEWIDAGDTGASVFCFLRKGGDRPVLVVLNLTPVTRPGYRFGVPVAGPWEVLLNSDDERYWGSGSGTSGLVEATETPMHGRSHSLSVDLPPLGVLFLAPRS
jgi:1,4-alpha-glucan branching enzyme